MTDSPKIPDKRKQQLLAMSIGERLCRAREAAGLSQLAAAQQIGYANSTKLSKLETGKHSNQIPLWVLKRATEVYGVSLDYLFNTGDLGVKAEDEHIKSLMLETNELESASITELLNHTTTGREELAGAIRVLSVEMDMLKVRNPHLVGLCRLDSAVTLVTTALARYSGALTSPAKLNMQALTNLKSLNSRAGAFV